MISRGDCRTQFRTERIDRARDHNESDLVGSGLPPPLEDGPLAPSPLPLLLVEYQVDQDLLVRHARQHGLASEFLVVERHLGEA